MELPWYNEALGNPNALAFVANAYNDLSEITTFWRRLRNVIRMHQTKYEFYQYTGKAQTEAMRRYLHPNTPDVRELEKTVALSFINSFYTYNGVKSKTPAAIDIAGIHIEQDDKQLSPVSRDFFHKQFGTYSTKYVLYYRKNCTEKIAN